MPKWNIFSGHNSTPQRVKKTCFPSSVFQRFCFYFIFVRKQKCSALKWYLIFYNIACELDPANSTLNVGKSRFVVLQCMIILFTPLTLMTWSAPKMVNFGTFGLVTYPFNRLQLMRCRWKGKHMGFSMIWHLTQRIYHIFQFPNFLWGV